MTNVDHVEVAPRMWDKTIAATYVPKNNEPPEVTETLQRAAVKHTPSLFNKLKAYLISALFVLGIIMVSYVLWKYFTKYRNAKAVAKIPTIEASELSEKKETINPAQIIASEDLTKYEYDSDDDEAKAGDDELDELLKAVQEEEEEEDEGEDEEEEDAVSIDRFNSEKDESDAPNISHIQQLIKEQGAEEHTPTLESEEDNTFAINYVDEDPQPKTRKPRKPKKVKKLIDQHNQISYQKVTLVVPLIAFKHKKPKDPVSAEIITFYEQYITQLAIVERLKDILNTISYTNEDLTFHIDRSAESLVKILSKLTKIKSKFAQIYEAIINNIMTDTNAFVQYVASLVDTKSDLREIIDTIYSCMKKQSLKETDDVNTHPFIHLGASLVEAIYNRDLLTGELIDHVHELNSELKQTIFQAKQTSTTTFNRLQRFRLVPGEGQNITIKDVAHHLFGLEMDVPKSTKETLIHLNRVLKLVTADTGVSTGLIIMVSPNQDIYFDMLNLQSLDKSFDTAGVSATMIDTFDLIKHGNKPKVKSSELLTIGIDPDTTEMAYVLWTNDMETFKYKTMPIHRSLINKLIRQSPSVTITAYNELLTEIIETARTEDVMSFNRTKYMSFNESVTENSFLNMLQSKLVAAIMNEIGKLQHEKLTSAIVDTEFTKMLMDTIERHKRDLGINTKALSHHCHIIYASMGNKIISKVKKGLLTLPAISKDVLNDIVETAVKSNDNIYSRTIASYYLQIA